jgi:hypothetical protein
MVCDVCQKADSSEPIIIMVGDGKRVAPMVVARPCEDCRLYLLFEIGKAIATVTLLRRV